MIPDEELRAEIKCYKLVSPFKKISEHVVYKQPSKVTLHDAVTALAATQTEAAPKKSGTKGKDKGSAKGEGETYLTIDCYLGCYRREDA